MDYICSFSMSDIYLSLDAFKNPVVIVFCVLMVVFFSLFLASSLIAEKIAKKTQKNEKDILLVLKILFGVLLVLSALIAVIVSR